MAKKSKRLLTLTLCAGLLCSLAVSAAEIEVAGDTEILADSEAIGQQQSPEPQELAPALWWPAMQWEEPVVLEGTCSAEHNCPPQISCTGSSTCSTGTVCYGLWYVDCDGNRTYCPRQCDPSAYCCSWQYCDRYYCAGIGPGACNQGCCECLE